MVQEIVFVLRAVDLRDLTTSSERYNIETVTPHMIPRMQSRSTHNCINTLRFYVSVCV